MSNLMEKRLVIFCSVEWNLAKKSTLRIMTRQSAHQGRYVQLQAKKVRFTSSIKRQKLLEK